MAMPTSANFVQRAAARTLSPRMPASRTPILNAALARLAFALLALTLLAQLGACASEETCSLRVQVRRGPDHQPVHVAVVFAETPSRDHPFSVASLLGHTGPQSSTEVLDERGVAIITCPRERPLRLGVMTHDWGPGFVFLNPHPGLSGQPLEWTQLQLEPGKSGDPNQLVEVRVEPIGAEPARVEPVSDKPS